MKPVLAILLLSCTCQAQMELYKRPHRFMDSANVILQGAVVATMTADVLTSRNAPPGTREGNPLAANGRLIPLKVAAIGASVGISYGLHRTGHHRLERVVPLVIAVPSGLAAIHNSRVAGGKYVD